MKYFVPSIVVVHLRVGVNPVIPGPQSVAISPSADQLTDAGDRTIAALFAATGSGAQLTRASRFLGASSISSLSGTQAGTGRTSSLYSISKKVPGRNLPDVTGKGRLKPGSMSPCAGHPPPCGVAKRDSLRLSVDTPAAILNSTRVAFA